MPDIPLKTYTELMRLRDFDSRFNYLNVRSSVGIETFGFSRYVNQAFYKSYAWQQARNFVIVRDNGCDLGCPEYEIPSMTGLLVHHMNPVTLDQLENADPITLDPEFLITVSTNTHKALHYGTVNSAPRLPTERRPNDTTLWERRPN